MMGRRRLLWLCVLAAVLGLFAAPVAFCLINLIHFFTGVFFHGSFSFDSASPVDNSLGVWVIFIPVAGGLIVGLMARWGAAAIRGHGIPEAMEKVLLDDSRIPARITLLKPLSSAISIGSGGPFGAEGPIIATGGALGSLLGQILHITAQERKILLAAGAAAGMAAVFSAPLSAVLLAVELLLFEFRGRSLLPVVISTVVATVCRYGLLGTDPVFAMTTIAMPGAGAMLFYAILGIIIGVLSVLVTRLLYRIEDAFETLPLHWMWWPALGGLAVGVVGYWVPQTMGVGYDLIRDIINGRLAFEALLLLGIAKWISWSIALGSGTSGGTLAPLFIIGGSLGAVLGMAADALFPGLGINIGLAGLVGMAAMFSGASRALLTAIVFALEVTREPDGVLPLMAGCGLAWLVSSAFMRTTIMTEKISRRGVRVPDEYAADPLEQVSVGQVCTTDVITINGDQKVAGVREWLASDVSSTHHQGFPLIGPNQTLRGVVTRRDIWRLDVDGAAPIAELVRRPPVTTTPQASLRQAADKMVREGVGRLIVVNERESDRVVGIITRSDIIKSRSPFLESREERSRSIRWSRDD
ncbi:chloride channel [Alcanivorax hongdengensis A-11-3]|uniref:Chloride channel n=2 Tax=Alcanivorax hongdengensis TaxID=519051 RepID=L0W7T9_9GAMM|nr:chloride channel [Alcanivorax hongdengensis A-11-3]